VVALGASGDEVSDLIREAVNAYAEEMAELGRELPDPVAATGTVKAA
jgi:predicted RNase H-like HicB family nuclease